MRTKAEGRHRGNGKRPIRGTALKTPEMYHETAKKTSLPRLNPLAIIALRRYRDELTKLPFNQEASEIVACIDRVLSLAGGA